MQGQSSPVQVKDPYTGSILMHVGSSCKHTAVQCTPPKNNQKLIDGSNKKTKQDILVSGTWWPLNFTLLGLQAAFLIIFILHLIGSKYLDGYI